jgi:hypothetical protein
MGWERGRGAKWRSRQAGEWMSQPNAPSSKSLAALASLLLAAALYIGTYAILDYQRVVHFERAAGPRKLVHHLFGPVHAADRRLRSRYWSTREFQFIVERSGGGGINPVIVDAQTTQLFSDELDAAANRGESQTTDTDSSEQN